jgi:hypothetical protein
MDADWLISIKLWMKKLTLALEVSTYPLNSCGILLLHVGTHGTCLHPSYISVFHISGQLL